MKSHFKICVFALMAMALICFRPVQYMAAEFEDVMSGEGWINYNYGEHDALTYQYKIIFRITPIDSSQDASATFQYKSGGRNITQSLTLNNATKEDSRVLAFDGQLGNTGVGSDYITANASFIQNARTEIILQRKSLGYEYVNRIIVNSTASVAPFDATVSYYVTNADMYDYYISYLVAIPFNGASSAELKASIPETNKILFSQRFVPITGNYGLINISDALAGNNLHVTLEAHVGAGSNLTGAEIGLFRKLKPAAGSSISISNPYIGDNTPVSVNVKFTGDNTVFFELYSANTGQILHIGNPGGYSGTINLNWNLSGDTAIGIRAKDTSNGNVLFVGNTVVVNKKNMLDAAITNLNAVKATAQVAILNDRDRYFEDNAQNRALVQTILQRAAGTYLIYNDVSPVLQPLLGN